MSDQEPLRWVRKGYELDVTFLGRPVRPFHLAVTIATAVVAATFLSDGSMEWWNHTATHLIGALAFTSSVLLTVGWWLRNEWAAEWGLLLSTGVWLSRAVYALLAGEGLIINNPAASFFLSLAWAVGAGGAYLLERIDHGSREGPGE